jgi:hypothetical protein
MAAIFNRQAAADQARNAYRDVTAPGKRLLWVKLENSRRGGVLNDPAKITRLNGFDLQVPEPDAT